MSPSTNVKRKLGHVYNLDDIVCESSTKSIGVKEGIVSTQLLIPKVKKWVLLNVSNNFPFGVFYLTYPIQQQFCAFMVCQKYPIYWFHICGFFHFMLSTTLDSLINVIIYLFLNNICVYCKYDACLRMYVSKWIKKWCYITQFLLRFEKTRPFL